MLAETERTRAARPPEPRDTDTVTHRMSCDGSSHGLDLTDNLVPGYDRNRRLGQLAVDDV